MNSLRNSVSRRLLASVLAGVLVFAAVLGFLALRPSAYQGRVGLLATQVSEPGGNSDFGSVVALGLPAVVDLAHSPSLLSTVSTSVAGAPSADDLSHQVSVDLVPDSGLARITVTADSPELAGALTSAVASELVAANLMAPTATLRSLDPVPDVTEAAPNWAMAGGLALAAGAAAAIAFAAALSLSRPSAQARVERALASTPGRRQPVSVLTLGDDDPAVLDQLGVLAIAGARPVRVVAMEASVSERAEKLAVELANAGVPVAGDDTIDTAAPVVAVAQRSVRSEVLGSAVAALPAESTLVAVVLQ